MEKDFDKWNEVKKKISNFYNCPIFYEKEIWNCHLGINVGDEQNGKGEDFLRPILVYKKFNQNIFWGIPLTTVNKKGVFYYEFKFNNQNNWAILSQIKLTDVHRLSYKMGDISETDYICLNKKLLDLHPKAF